jgi:FkbM family methyltransferase
MAYLSFTRNFEDVMINRALSQVPQGFFIDVGAYQPVADSNTFCLYQRGWRGLVVEPQTRFHPLWEAQRPEDILVRGAVGSTTGEVTFFEIAQREQNATTSEAIAAMHAREGKPVQRHTVQQYTLTDLLQQHRPSGDIHLLSVDVEGAELAVLQGLDRTRFRPWLIVLESTLPNRPQTNFDEWEPELLHTGYDFVYFDAVNRFYVAQEHAELKQFFQHPPCVWDNFVDYRLVQAQQTAAKAQAELAQLKATLRKLSE